MANLIAKSPCSGLVPVAHGTVTLSEPEPAPITSVAPFNGQARAVSAALKEALGVGLPAANRTAARAGTRVVSVGPGKALVIGASVAPDGAAVTDQSDGWARLVLEGPGARDVLARLCPADLRDDRFKTGHAAQSLLGHMTCTVMRTGAARFELLVFRSMAATAVHELEFAMRSVAAR